jgi:anhydro-N-acetylmuramic acid kinase
LDNGIARGEPVWVAGFMSGTSVDAVDGAMILTDGEEIVDFGPTAERKYKRGERATIMEAVAAARAWRFEGEEPREAFAAAEAVLRIAHLDALAMMSGGPTPELIGVHGQTVLHRRPVDGRKGATQQIFDIEGFAAAAGLPVWYDFRSADVAAGGEGAPLAPVYHRALLRRAGIDEGVVLNLGGVANPTIVKAGGELVAFDCGPANGPIDEWVDGHDAGTHDAGGALAAAGRVNEAILTEVMDHPFFDEPPPKSLDRFDFSANLVRGLSLEDGAATLVEIAALGVARGIGITGARPDRIVACGGGRHNPSLMAALNRVCSCPVVPAEAMGWRGDSIEAEAFAFLAARAARGLPISFPATTGAPEPMTGGRLQQP